MCKLYRVTLWKGSRARAIIPHRKKDKRGYAMKASTKATEKYQSRVYDKTALRVKKGTFDRIRALGYESINGFAAAAVMEKLEREENPDTPPERSET